MVDGRLPTVPEYYEEHISRGTDLTMYPKQCCPFHQENTPSFSYNIQSGRWSCFGKCHAHGDVVDMHMRYYHFISREEAQRDLEVRYNVPRESAMQKMLRASSILVRKDTVDDESTYALALSLANTPERWVELDYVMSIHPFDRARIQTLINKWQYPDG